MPGLVRKKKSLEQHRGQGAAEKKKARQAYQVAATFDNIEQVHRSEHRLMGAKNVGGLYN